MAVQHDPRQAVTEWYTVMFERHDSAGMVAYAKGDRKAGERHHVAAQALAWCLESEMRDSHPHGLKQR